MHTPATCVTCAAAEKLGFDEEGSIFFHQMIAANIAILDVVRRAEEVGVDLSTEAVEAAVDDVLDQLYTIPPALLN